MNRLFFPCPRSKKSTLLSPIGTFFSILLFVGLFSACKREYIEVEPDSEGTPVFDTQFSINGTTHSYTAGLEDYYMHTRFEEDADQVLTYIGNMVKEDCTSTCASSIQFEIRSTQFANETSAEEDLSPRPYIYKDDTEEETDIIQVRLDGSYEEDNVETISWGGFGSSLRIFDKSSIIYNHKYDGTPSTTFSPVFKVNSTEGHFASISKKIDLEGDTFCDGDFTITENQNGMLTMQSSYEASSNPLLYFWFYGRNGEYHSPEEAIIVPRDSVQHWNIDLQIQHLDGCFTDVTRTFSQDANSNLSYANVDYAYEVMRKIEGGSRLGLSTFTIQYVDEYGMVYRSDRGSQPDNSVIRIVEVENYQDNVNGDATKKLTIEYSNCRLYAEDGSILRIENGKGVIAVAHP